MSKSKNESVVDKPYKGDGFMYGLSVVDREARSNKSARVIPQIEYDEPLVKQSFKDEVDVNNIIDKYMRTGVLPETRDIVGQYLDLINIPDYQSALNTVIQAEEMFDSLPAQVRDRFRNNPQELLDFVADDKNYDEAIKLGLLDAAAVERRSPKKTPDSAPKGGQPGSPTGDPKGE